LPRWFGCFFRVNLPLIGILLHHEQTRVLVYERALKFLPACYKIWHDYLTFRRQKVGSACLAQLYPPPTIVPNGFPPLSGPRT
jgi:hypothetical protein